MIRAKLMHNTPLSICSHAVRTCWQSHDRSDNGGPKDQELIHKVGNKYKHASTLEHLVYTFYLDNISRALLQELARHRIASLSVKSTRYTLKELKDEEPFNKAIEAGGRTYQLTEHYERAQKYLVMTGIVPVDVATINALEALRQLIADGIPNDVAKFALPDAYKTELTWSINARSLQNFLYLRTATSAMWEIRLLAYDIFDALPDDHKFLFEEFVHAK